MHRMAVEFSKLAKIKSLSQTINKNMDAKHHCPPVYVNKHVAIVIREHPRLEHLLPAQRYD